LTNIDQHDLRIIAAAHDHAITSRRSIRAFGISARAPSGTNVQPWKVYALAGQAKDALSAAILDKHNSTGMDGREFDYYPTEWADPWLSRRRKIGFDLYGLLGIGKADKDRMKEQTGRRRAGRFHLHHGCLAAPDVEDLTHRP
jgi:nitroreductase